MSAWTRHIRGRDSSISLRIAHVIKIIIATRMENTGMAHSRSKGFLAAACPSVLPQELLSRSSLLLQQLAPTQHTLSLTYIINTFYSPLFYILINAEEYVLQHTVWHTAQPRMLFHIYPSLLLFYIMLLKNPMDFT